MAPSSFLALLSFTLVTLLAASFATPANAVSLHGEHVVRGSHHNDIARRKTSKRANRTCKAPTSASASASSLSSTKASSSTSKTSSSTAAAKTTTTKTTAKTTSTTKAAPKATTPASTSSSSGSSSSGSSSSGSSSSGSSSSGSSSSGSSSGSGNGLDFGGKACLAWPNGPWNPLGPWKGSNTGMIYSWDANIIPDAAKYGFTYAPMLWGDKDVANFKAKVVKGYASVALGMNEPNEAGQSNMDAYHGIDLWKQYLLPLADQGYTLVSPAMSSRPNGKDWMATFMSQCGDCKVSAIATHYYGTDFEEFKTYVTYWHTTYNLPVLITEYADQDFNGGPQASMDEIWAFMTQATDFVNQNDWIKAHCWFGAMTGMDNVNPLNTLMTSSGSGPNSLGQWFINN
ncbi:glycosyl hydrolase catalytic core-domain-containing protein [Roridomyces roridus]|uniref:Glycosyl hydrolase catalytic core-domain-containing protein n=1 Tax=Roridomyces roridus TaxID=1738132 RepID=A0AAD7C4A0_9AGAR|nr:glycosyl hydrolase catalytic core-domain-containing protein [Roridomyces roridus]